MLKIFSNNIQLSVFVLSGLISFVSCGKSDQDNFIEWLNQEGGIKAWERTTINGISSKSLSSLNFSWYS